MDNFLEDALKAGGLEIDSVEVAGGELESEVGKRSEEVKRELEKMSVTTNNLMFAFEDVNGEPISPREENGTYFIDMIDIDKIAYSGSRETQIRQGELNVFEIQQNIEKVDLISPIHVIPFGRPINSHGDGLPKYARYIILDGTRRYEAYRTLGRKSILAVVNTTINKQLIEMYKGIIQNNREYSFSEKVAYADRIKKEQRSMSVETLENFLGYRSGEFLKSLYIDQMKVDYPDIYNQVEKNKLSIEQGFKRLEKEIEKAEKALEAVDEEVEVEDEGDDLSQLQIDAHTQELGNREYLDSNLRRAVESRDSGTCQCCGFGSGEDDFMGGFNAHHMIPVMYQGPDMKNNLILLCKNCHGFVHDYETGRFNPDKRTYEAHLWVQKVVVLGNMLRKLRKKSIADIKKVDPNTYNLLQKGSLSLGKAIVKSNLSVNGLALFNNDPYQTFIDAITELGSDNVGNNEFNGLERFEEDEDNQEIVENSPHKTPNTEPIKEHMPRNISLEQIHATSDRNKEIVENAEDNETGDLENPSQNLLDGEKETMTDNEISENQPEEIVDVPFDSETYYDELTEEEKLEALDSIAPLDEKDVPELIPDDSEFESEDVEDEDEDEDLDSKLEEIQKEIETLEKEIKTASSEPVSYDEDVDLYDLLEEDDEDAPEEENDNEGYKPLPENLAKYLR